ncbi:hypothetical protein ACI2L4_39645 [Streptomyces sparsogenes]|uniref:hypothetical protein n=1 Tax=Streptomyces sparsogenes TaxID=67365 RepID=UPI00384FB501
MEDLVELVPKRGARVAPLAGREIRELMEPRGIVERYAAQRLVSQGRAPVAELRSLLERQREFTGELAGPGEPGGKTYDVTELNPSLAGAAGEIVTTAPDLNRFYRAQRRYPGLDIGGPDHRGRQARPGAQLQRGLERA